MLKRTFINLTSYIRRLKTLFLYTVIFVLFQRCLKKKQIHFLTAQNQETESSIAERMIRTLSSRIWRHFAFKDGYLDVLPDFSRSYNATFHRSVKRSNHRWLSHNQLAIVQQIGYLSATA